MKKSILSLRKNAWQNPLIKKGRLGSPLVEVTPFVFKDRLYRLENWSYSFGVPDANPRECFLQDEVRIRDVESERIVSVALRGHGFGIAFVWDNRAHVFAGDYGRNKPWRRITEINLTTSDDLAHWTPPRTVIRAGPNEYLFNTAVCRGRDQFVLLYETNDPAWPPPFTFKYCVADDLLHWRCVPDAIYGRNKYVGGPALYFEGDWYYTLYLQDLGHSQWETRVTRSKDLLNWEDAPEGRPFVTFDRRHRNLPLRPPELCETNASDAELCYFRGKTIVYFTGGDQHVAGDLQWAEFDGPPRELLENFFETEGTI